MNQLVEVGVIIDIQADPLRYKVKFDDVRDSDWLIQLTSHAGTEQKWSPLEINEQVLVLKAIGIDQGFILGSINQAAFPQPQDKLTVIYHDYSDGSWTRYDQSTNKLSFHCVGDIVGSADGGFDLTGNFKITGDVELVGNLKQTGNQDIDGATKTTGDQVAGTISQMKHGHNKVASGKDVSGQPVA